jgi:hypothetical protein
MMKLFMMKAYDDIGKEFAISLVLTWTCDLSVLDLEANVSRKCDMVATLLSAYKWCGNS